MPDIDTLMQEWPEDFEELLKEVSTLLVNKIDFFPAIVISLILCW